VTRKLPKAKVGDLLILHDAGAYGAAMSSNYNSRRYAGEVMFTKGELKVIRERQTFEQLLQNDRIIEL
jgi:diaminopimelate decarboxylase